MRRFLARLCGDRRGVTVVEFAIIAPVMCMTLMGLGDLLYQPYLQSLLEGSLQKAARDSALEDNAANGDALDDKVRAMVGNIAKNATYTISRKSYANFSLVKPESFNDINGDGIRQVGECYDDVNRNNRWDADPGITGQGGANDVTSYTVTVNYPRLFPVAGLFGFSPTQTVTARTLLKNQPYKTQLTSTIPSVCT